MSTNQPRKPAGAQDGGQFASVPHDESEIELTQPTPSERQFRVLYAIRSGIDNKRYSVNEATVKAATPDDAAGKAVDWAYKNDPRCDERAQSFVEVLSAAEVADEQCCYECGGPCFVDENGVAYHIGEDGGIDHDTDADHVAVPEPAQ